MQAKDVMTTEVITVSPETSVTDIAQILLEHRISAVPVLDTAGHLVGIVSEGDLIHRGNEDGTHSWWLRIFSAPEKRVREYLRTHGTCAEHVMTRELISVSEETELGEIAQLLEERQIKRVPVVRDGALVGIVSRSNLLQALVARRGQIERGAPADDRAVRQAIVRALRDQEWLVHGPPNPVVTDGVVELWGRVASEQERKALKLLVEQTEGVREYRDHLIVQPSVASGPDYV